MPWGAQQRGTSPRLQADSRTQQHWGRQAHAHVHASRGPPHPVPRRSKPESSTPACPAEAGSSTRGWGAGQTAFAQTATLSKACAAQPPLPEQSGNHRREKQDRCGPGTTSRRVAPAACLSMWGQGAPALPGTQDKGGDTQSSPVLSLTPFPCRKQELLGAEVGGLPHYVSFSIL